MTKFQKLAEAIKILERCLGQNGVWADPTRYKHQLWTRDFGLAIQPALHLLGHTSHAALHLENLSARQQPNGQMPIIFLDGAEGEAAFVAEKEARSQETGKVSFMLRRYREGQLWNLTPGTRDSELLYIIGMYEYAKATGDESLVEHCQPQIQAALVHLEQNLMANGLHTGCDWRDTMEEELGRKALLTNNSLLVHLYDLMGQQDKASTLRQRINERFWAGDVLQDWPGNTRFDPLGGSLAVLHDVVGADQYPAIIACFQSVDTNYGVTIKCRHNPVSAEEAEVIERTDGEVVWPFIVGFSVLALLKMGRRDLALGQFNKLAALQDFREWYDPANGKGYGALQQLWSATLYIRAFAALYGVE